MTIFGRVFLNAIKAAIRDHPRLTAFIVGGEVLALAFDGWAWVVAVSFWIGTWAYVALALRVAEVFEVDRALGEIQRSLGGHYHVTTADALQALGRTLASGLAETARIVTAAFTAWADSLALVNEAQEARVDPIVPLPTEVKPLVPLRRPRPGEVGGVRVHPKGLR